MTAEDWNAKYPEGSIVHYYPVRGQTRHEVTRTRSAAWTLASGDAVVMVVGRSGCVAIEHLAPEDANGEAPSPWR